MNKTWTAIFFMVIGFASGNLFQIQVCAPEYRKSVFEHFFYKRSKCLGSEAYTNGKETWVVEDNWKFVYIKGAPEPCREDGSQ